MIDFVVVQENVTPIIGLETCLKEKFLIVPGLNTINKITKSMTENDLCKDYRDVFSGLGKIGN